MPLFKKRPKPVELESVAQLDEILASGQPTLIDFMQFGCAPCQVMDGIVNELAEEFDGTARVVKANAAWVPEVFDRYKVRSTPTFILLDASGGTVVQRWRTSGLVKKDMLTSRLEAAASRL